VHEQQRRPSASCQQADADVIGADHRMSCSLHRTPAYENQGDKGNRASSPLPCHDSHSSHAIDLAHSVAPKANPLRRVEDANNGSGVSLSGHSAEGSCRQGFRSPTDVEIGQIVGREGFVFCDLREPEPTTASGAASDDHGTRQAGTSFGSDALMTQRLRAWSV
jgi:hypothetical protein